MFNKVLLSILLALKIASIRPELFTSYEAMRKLVRSQVEITNHLSEYFRFQEKKMSEAKRVLNNFQEFSNSVQTQENFIGNPVNAYLLIKLMVKDLQNFVDALNTMDELKKLVRDLKESHDLPNNEDYEGVIKALNRLEDTYLLDPKDIRTGRLNTKHPSRPLNGKNYLEKKNSLILISFSI